MKFPLGRLVFIPDSLITNPTKVKVVERECAEGEAKLWDSTVGRIVSLLLVAPAHAVSELEASVDKLFDKGGITEQGDSATDGVHDADIKLVTAAKDVAAVTTERPRRQRKKGQRGATTRGNSVSILKELLASSILNVKVGVKTVATLPLGTSLVSTTSRREDGNPTDSITGLNLCTIGAFERFIISSDSSHHSSTHASRAEVDSIIRFVVLLLIMTEAVVTSHAVNALSILVLEMGTKMTSLVHVYMFYDFDFREIVRADTAEFNVGTARQACLNAKVRMQTEYCLSERSRLESECKKQADLLKARDDEVENLKARLLLKEAEVAEAARLHIQVFVVEAMKRVHVDKLNALKQKSDLELKDFNNTVSSLKSQNDGLVKRCMHWKPHVSASVIRCQGGKAGCRSLGEGSSSERKVLSSPPCHYIWPEAGIDHGKASGNLKDIVAYNPAAEMDYNSALQRFREVDFPLLVELSSHKDASVADIMDLLRLKSPLADAPGMSDLQPDVEQLMLPNHRPKDQKVLDKTSLSFSLSASHSRVEKIRENISAQRSALVDVWVPLVDPLSSKNLMGVTGTSDSVPATVATTTTLSTTFASASFVPPITIEDYEIACTDGQEDA
nr:hypothetical protein [Tanacetum cinerariifolium]